MDNTHGLRPRTHGQHTRSQTKDTWTTRTVSDQGHMDNTHGLRPRTHGQHTRSQTKDTWTTHTVSDQGHMDNTHGLRPRTHGQHTRSQTKDTWTTHTVSDQGHMDNTHGLRPRTHGQHTRSQTKDTWTTHTVSDQGHMDNTHGLRPRTHGQHTRSQTKDTWTTRTISDQGRAWVASYKYCSQLPYLGSLQEVQLVAPGPTHCSHRAWQSSHTFPEEMKSSREHSSRQMKLGEGQGSSQASALVYTAHVTYLVTSTSETSFTKSLAHCMQSDEVGPSQPLQAGSQGRQNRVVDWKYSAGNK